MLTSINDSVQTIFSNLVTLQGRASRGNHREENGNLGRRSFPRQPFGLEDMLPQLIGNYLWQSRVYGIGMHESYRFP